MGRMSSASSACPRPRHRRAGPGDLPAAGLDAQAASVLVDKILERHGAVRWLDDEPRPHPACWPSCGRVMPVRTRPG